MKNENRISTIEDRTKGINYVKKNKEYLLYSSLTPIRNHTLELSKNEIDYTIINAMLDDVDDNIELFSHLLVNLEHLEDIIDDNFQLLNNKNENRLQKEITKNSEIFTFQLLGTDEIILKKDKFRDKFSILEKIDVDENNKPIYNEIKFKDISKIKNYFKVLLIKDLLKNEDTNELIDTPIITEDISLSEESKFLFTTNKTRIKKTFDSSDTYGYIWLDQNKKRIANYIDFILPKFNKQIERIADNEKIDVIKTINLGSQERARVIDETKSSIVFTKIKENNEYFIKTHKGEDKNNFTITNLKGEIFDSNNKIISKKQEKKLLNFNDSKSSNKEYLNEVETIKQSILDNKYISYTEIGPGSSSIETTKLFSLLNKLNLDLDIPFQLKIRKLGNHKAYGLYFPDEKIVSFDVSKPFSLIHEIVHHIDYSYEEVNGKFLLSDETLNRFDMYNDYSLFEDSTYYMDPREITARMGEVAYTLNESKFFDIYSYLTTKDIDIKNEILKNIDLGEFKELTKDNYFEILKLNSYWDGLSKDLEYYIENENIYGSLSQRTFEEMSEIYLSYQKVFNLDKTKQIDQQQFQTKTLPNIIKTYETIKEKQILKIGLNSYSINSIKDVIQSFNENRISKDKITFDDFFKQLLISPDLKLKPRNEFIDEVINNNFDNNIYNFSRNDLIEKSKIVLDDLINEEDVNPLSLIIILESDLLDIRELNKYKESISIKLIDILNQNLPKYNIDGILRLFNSDTIIKNFPNNNEFRLKVDQFIINIIDLIEDRYDTNINMKRILINQMGNNNYLERYIFTTYSFDGKSKDRFKDFIKSTVDSLTTPNIIINDSYNKIFNIRNKLINLEQFEKNEIIDIFSNIIEKLETIKINPNKVKKIIDLMKQTIIDDNEEDLIILRQIEDQLQSLQYDLNKTITNEGYSLLRGEFILRSRILENKDKSELTQTILNNMLNEINLIIENNNFLGNDKTQQKIINNNFNLITDILKLDTQVMLFNGYQKKIEPTDTIKILTDIFYVINNLSKLNKFNSDMNGANIIDFILSNDQNYRSTDSFYGKFINNEKEFGDISKKLKEDFTKILNSYIDTKFNVNIKLEQENFIGKNNIKEQIEVYFPKLTNKYDISTDNITNITNTLLIFLKENNTNMTNYNLVLNTLNIIPFKELSNKENLRIIDEILKSTEHLDDNEYLEVFTFINNKFKDIDISITNDIYIKKLFNIIKNNDSLNKDITKFIKYFSAEQKKELNIISIDFINDLKNYTIEQKKELKLKIKNSEKITIIKIDEDNFDGNIKDLIDYLNFIKEIDEIEISNIEIGSLNVNNDNNIEIIDNNGNKLNESFDVDVLYTSNYGMKRMKLDEYSFNGENKNILIPYSNYRGTASAYKDVINEYFMKNKDLLLNKEKTGFNFVYETIVDGKLELLNLEIRNFKINKKGDSIRVNKNDFRTGEIIVLDKDIKFELDSNIPKLITKDNKSFNLEIKLENQKSRNIKLNNGKFTQEFENDNSSVIQNFLNVNKRVYNKHKNLFQTILSNENITNEEIRILSKQLFNFKYERIGAGEIFNSIDLSSIKDEKKINIIFEELIKSNLNSLETHLNSSINFENLFNRFLNNSKIDIGTIMTEYNEIITNVSENKLKEIKNNPKIENEELFVLNETTTLKIKLIQQRFNNINKIINKSLEDNGILLSMPRAKVNYDIVLNNILPKLGDEDFKKLFQEFYKQKLKTNVKDNEISLNTLIPMLSQIAKMKVILDIPYDYFPLISDFNARSDKKSITFNDEKDEELLDTVLENVFTFREKIKTTSKEIIKLYLLEEKLNFSKNKNNNIDLPKENIKPIDNNEDIDDKKKKVIKENISKTKEISINSEFKYEFILENLMVFEFDKNEINNIFAKNQNLDINEIVKLIEEQYEFELDDDGYFNKEDIDNNRKKLLTFIIELKDNLELSKKPIKIEENIDEVDVNDEIDINETIINDYKLELEKDIKETTNMIEYISTKINDTNIVDTIDTLKLLLTEFNSKKENAEKKLNVLNKLIQDIGYDGISIKINDTKSMLKIEIDKIDKELLNIDNTKLIIKDNNSNLNIVDNIINKLNTKKENLLDEKNEMKTFIESNNNELLGLILNEKIIAKDINKKLNNINII